VTSGSKSIAQSFIAPTDARAGLNYLNVLNELNKTSMSMAKRETA